MKRIDLNCDLGESYGAFKIGNDSEIMKYISSANIACGFHAGDPDVMRKTVTLALEHGIAIGAHPGLPDLVGFGRREMNISPDDVYNLTVYQIGALNGFVVAEGARLHHVKPHGALYNMCAVNQVLAEAVAKAIYDVDSELILYGLANSHLISAGKKVGLRTANEVFADRTYEDDGTLTPRNRENSTISDKHTAVHQVLTMVKRGLVTSVSGKSISISADTVCIHGDNSHALELAQCLFESLEKDNIHIKAL